jgi:hypothetical protein
MQQSPARTISAEASVPMVLVVDDNDDDLVLFERAVRQVEYSGTGRYIDSGSQAIAYLAGAGEFADRAQFPAADFLILDLKMLAWLQQQGVSSVRTVVLTSSDDMADIASLRAGGGFVSR